MEKIIEELHNIVLANQSNWWIDSFLPILLSGIISALISLLVAWFVFKKNKKRDEDANVYLNILSPIFKRLKVADKTTAFSTITFNTCNTINESMLNPLYYLMHKNLRKKLDEFSGVYQEQNKVDLSEINARIVKDYILLKFNKKCDFEKNSNDEYNFFEKFGLRMPMYFPGGKQENYATILGNEFEKYRAVFEQNGVAYDNFFNDLNYEAKFDSNADAKKYNNLIVRLETLQKEICTSIENYIK